MKIVCHNCLHVCDAEDLETHSEQLGWYGSAPYCEEWDACPVCGSDQLEIIPANLADDEDFNPERFIAGDYFEGV